MVDPPAAVMVAPVSVPVPMVPLPPDVQLAGVLVGSAPELGSAFLRIGSGPVETVRVGQGPKARSELVVTEITREGNHRAVPGTAVAAKGGCAREPGPAEGRVMGTLWVIFLQFPVGIALCPRVS